MAIANTMKMMRSLFEEIMHDLSKAERGNKSAAQRIRVNTVAFEKVAKIYRKESLAIERKELSKSATKKTTLKKIKKK